MNLNLSIDKWGEVTTSQETARGIAIALVVSGSALIGWTDGNATHHDILFCIVRDHCGNFQGGVNPKTHIFISVMRLGCFAFRLGENELATSYYDEKLAHATADMAKLFNMVRKEYVVYNRKQGQYVRKARV